jgi:hypothetical protein
MKARFWPTTLAIAATVVVRAAHLDAAEKKIRITGIYSDLTYSQEGGDLLGTEIFLVSAQEHGYFAFVQSWAGGTTPPVVVPVQVDGDKVTFAVPAPSIGEGNYEGRISGTGFDGTCRRPLASGGFSEEPIRLKRKKSYWE